jgi:hypothetical protein
MATEHMLSLFYVDGDRLAHDRLLLFGHQPRRQATLSPDLKTISFDFLDATNLPSRRAGHLHRAGAVHLFRFHHGQEWTWMQDGKVQLAAPRCSGKK